MNPNENNNLKIHFAYCVVILMGAIIIIADDRWSAHENFTTYLSNAATMTSLFLGLVAIFYSFIANHDLSKSLSNITTVSNDVQESKEQISTFLDQTRLTTLATESSNKLMQQVSEEVSLNLNSLTDTLRAVSEQTEALHKTVSDLPTRFDQLESKVIDTARSLGEKSDSFPKSSVKPEIADLLIQKFLATSSLTCNLLTYACILVKQESKELVLSDFCVAIGLNLESYLSGFLTCMDAIKLIDKNNVKDKKTTYSIAYIHPKLEQTTKEYILEFLNSTFYDTKPEVKKLWLKRLDSIERLYTQDLIP